jgi:hypothetical protein
MKASKPREMTKNGLFCPADNGGRARGSHSWSRYPQQRILNTSDKDITAAQDLLLRLIWSIRRLRSIYASPLI